MQTCVASNLDPGCVFVRKNHSGVLYMALKRPPWWTGRHRHHDEVLAAIVDGTDRGGMCLLEPREEVYLRLGEEET